MTIKSEGGKIARRLIVYRSAAGRNLQLLDRPSQRYPISNLNIVCMQKIAVRAEQNITQLLIRSKVWNRYFETLSQIIRL